MIGKTISHYKIVDKLGEGGMGVVYKAEDTKLKRTVALKFLPPQTLGTEEEKIRFISEAQAAAALSHPNICTIHEIGESEGQSFIVMEYVEGRSLNMIIESGPLGLDEVLDITIQVAGALSEAHEKNYVHRDIKPANIMVTAKGQAKIMDFGLAKGADRAQFTRTGTTLGTVVYMSPEQAEGGSVDHRTDIWSLGVALYEMVVGERPFEGDYEQAVVYLILNKEPEPITARRTGVPLELERIISKALSKSPNERYQHVDEMLVDLKSVAKGLESGEMKELLAMRKRKETKRRYLYAGILILIALIVVIRFYGFPGQSEAIDSIAVLPLENLSGDPDQDYFVEGMTETLINELSRIKALRVISRTSVMRFKDSEMTIPDIARELNVDAIIEGSVQRSGDRVRITAQLIKAVPEKQIWTDDHERDIGDILTLQKEVARAIAQEIKVAITPEEQMRLISFRTVNPEVEEAYLKGRFHNNKLTIESARKAVEYFEVAIEKDPDFALGYVGLGKSYDILASMGAMPDHEAWPKVEEFALKALSIDESLSEAHTLLGDVNFIYEWNWEEAEKAYRRAIELNPSSSTAHDWYALYLSAMGRYPEAIAEISKARELDPLSLGIRVTEIAIYGGARRYDRAEQLVNDLLEYYPDSYMTQMSLGYLYLRKSEYENAVYEFQNMYSYSQDVWVVSALAAAYALSGESEKAQELLDGMIEQSKQEYIPAYNIAMVYHTLGDRDRTFEWLEKAYEERSSDLLFLKTLSIFDDLQSDQRFERLMKKMGLE